MNDPIKQRAELLKKQEVSRLVNNRTQQVKGKVQQVLAIDLSALYNVSVEASDAVLLKRSIHALIDAAVKLERDLKKLNIKG